MEYMALQRCFTFLHDNGLPITTFVPEQRTSIAKHMKEMLPHICHLKVGRFYKPYTLNLGETFFKGAKFCNF